MVNRDRIQKVVNQIKAMNAADMKLVASFGKVKGYSQHYLELKEALRSLIGVANHVYGIDLQDDFDAIKPITFTGMIPNEAFIRERRRVTEVGQKLCSLIEAHTGEGEEESENATETAVPSNAGPRSKPSASGSAEAKAKTPAAKPKICVTVPWDVPVLRDIKRCLATADCDVVESTLPHASSTGFSPRAVIEEFEKYDGALICLMMPPPPEKKDGEGDDAKTASLAAGAAAGNAAKETGEASRQYGAKAQSDSAQKSLNGSGAAAVPPETKSPTHAPLFSATVKPEIANEDGQQASAAQAVALSKAASSRSAPSASFMEAPEVKSAGDTDVSTVTAPSVTAKISVGSPSAPVAAKSSAESNIAVVNFDTASKEQKPESTLKIDRALYIQYTLLQLGIALGRFPERTFFVVHDDFVNDLPGTLRDMISFYTSGASLSFDEGQLLVRTFNRADWNAS